MPELEEAWEHLLKTVKQYKWWRENKPDNWEEMYLQSMFDAADNIDELRGQ